jgi:hypothetical protein
MNRDQIIQFADKDPRFAKAVDMMEERLAQQPIVPEDMDELISFLEQILKDPSKYAEIRDAAIKDGEIDEGMFPPQFDMVFVVSLLVALYGLQDRMNQRGYSRGGLKVAGRRIAAQGRGGDTMLAHINPREAQMLMSRGASGTINPATGLPQFKSSWGSILGAILPIALSFIFPGVGTAIGAALGASGAFGTALGSAVIGAGAGAISGGAKGALIGGLTGGLGSYFLGPAIGQATDAIGLTGAGGLFGGEAASGAAEAASGAAGADIPLPPVRTTAAEFAASNSPANQVVQGLKSLIPGPDSTFKDYAKLGVLGLTAGSLLSQPEPVKAAVASLSPSQQEYFNRQPVNWDWDKMQSDANSRNMSLSEYMSSNWNNVTGGQYNKAAPAVAAAQPATAFAAQGGALNRISNLARGSGSGRDDTINARLSDGEYVMDAETVALLGDGSNAEGARRLDQMRKEIRAQKGKSLAKGKFSPNAKSPLAYLKGAA